MWGESRLQTTALDDELLCAIIFNAHTAVNTQRGQRAGNQTHNCVAVRLGAHHHSTLSPNVIRFHS